MIRITTRTTRKARNFTSSDNAVLVTRVYLHDGCTCTNGFTPAGEAATEEQAFEAAQKLNVVSVAYCTRSGAKAGQAVTAPAPVAQDAPVAGTKELTDAEVEAMRVLLVADWAAEVQLDEATVASLVAKGHLLPEAHLGGGLVRCEF